MWSRAKRVGKKGDLGDVGGGGIDTAAKDAGGLKDE